MVGLLDRFKKEDDGSGNQMVKERYDRSDEESVLDQKRIESEITRSQNTEIDMESKNFVSSKESESIENEIGIGALMNKRAKLEEAIDYVGLMIKNLKDKRTSLEKEIEDESVDIKNLKEKLAKVSEYIEEENRGIKELTQKRSQVEREADTVASMINNLREKLAGIDRIVDDEGNRVKKIKEARQSSEI